MVNGLDGAVGLHVPFPVEVVLATREGPVIRLYQHGEKEVIYPKLFKIVYGSAK
jgi:hypothetical protein